MPLHFAIVALCALGRYTFVAHVPLFSSSAIIQYFFKTVFFKTQEDFLSYSASNYVPQTAEDI
ncbi:MAG TPA: hypothetical protein VFZ99_08715, partial [Terriglobales bacterium]